MKYETAKCPSCGASIPVQPEFEQAFCPACGNRIVIKDAIQRHKVELSGPVVVDSNIDSIYKSANGFLQLEEWSDALQLFSKMIELDSTDYRGWWGIFLANTQNMRKFNQLGIDPPLDIKGAKNAIPMAPRVEKQKLISAYEEYLSTSPALHLMTLAWNKELLNSGLTYCVRFAGSDFKVAFTNELSSKFYVPEENQEMMLYGKLVGEPDSTLTLLKSITFIAVSDAVINIKGSKFSKISASTSGIKVIKEKTRTIFGQYK